MCFTVVLSSAIRRYFRDLGNSRYRSHTALDVSSRSYGSLCKVAQIMSAVHILTTCWPRLLLRQLKANENKHHVHSGMQCLLLISHVQAAVLFFFLVPYDCACCITQHHCHAAARHKQQIKHLRLFPADCSIYVLLTYLLFKHLKP